VSYKVKERIEKIMRISNELNLENPIVGSRIPSGRYPPIIKGERTSIEKHIIFYNTLQTGDIEMRYNNLSNWGLLHEARTFLEILIKRKTVEIKDRHCA